MEEQKELADSFIPMEIFTLGNGKTTKPMDMENIQLEMELCIKAIGYKTKEAGKEDSNGQTEQFLMEITKIIKRMDKVNLSGQMEITMSDSLRITENVVMGQ